MRDDLIETLKAGDLDAQQLSPFQRILLTTDGMVTEMLEAFLGERMVVRVLDQGDSNLAEMPGPLALERPTRLLRRHILLVGARSREPRIYAESLIVPGRLPESIRSGLLEQSKPIGQLLQESRLETFREIISCGTTTAGELAPHFGCAPEQPLISRTYRVFADRQPIMLITEKFPDTAFRDAGPDT
jgi:chorismate-pyruvate lyase